MIAAAFMAAGLLLLIFPAFDLMVLKADHYGELAKELHERERRIKASRGLILDRNGTVIASNRPVSTISVIHNQITDPDAVVEVLERELSLPHEDVTAKVEKRSSREIIRTNVPKETGDRIREMGLAGVKVDEDYKRYYPYGSLASHVLGFTGGENQGIIGLEVFYEDHLKGKDGKILTLTDARGTELQNAAEHREEPQKGDTLRLTLDVNIQKYAQQQALKVLKEKNAKAVSVIIMNPGNGEIYAMVNVPEFDLNEPFRLPEEGKMATEEALNQMWRNRCINDTYEPGSVFKLVTTAAGLDLGVVSEEDMFFCPGYRVVEDRRIRCHKNGGHGPETFTDGIKNSCNPVFIDVGQRIGTDGFYRYFDQFQLLKKTGIDLPGEAGTIMHRKEKVGPVELATISFGQSFQLTPIRLITTVSSLINGGKQITPHFAMTEESPDGTRIREFRFPEQDGILSPDTSLRVRKLAEQVVADGSGRKAQVPGYRIGGKTATSEKLPRNRKKYISSFLGFAPADDPEVIALITIDEPTGIYYGGTIAAPVIADIFQVILPYLGIKSFEGSG